jgi:hypothetical protein
MVLYVGYHNCPNDGGGNQIMRMISLYCICRKFKIQYAHCPITGINHVSFFRDIADDIDAMIKLFNSLLKPNKYCVLESDIPIDTEIIKLQEIHLIDLINYIKEGTSKNILVQTVHSRTIIHKNPELYEYAKEYVFAPVPAQPVKCNKKHLHIHIHHRLGDILCVEQWRRTPNSYLISLMEYMNSTVPKYYKKHTIHIHTEAPTKPTTILPGTSGILRQIKEPIVLMPADAQLDELMLPNVVIHNNEDEYETINAIAHADVFVMSYSSFSYLGALLNWDAIHLNNPRWHAPMPHWLDAGRPDFASVFEIAIRKRSKR